MTRLLKLDACCPLNASVGIKHPGGVWPNCLLPKRVERQTRSVEAPREVAVDVRSAQLARLSARPRARLTEDQVAAWQEHHRALNAKKGSATAGSRLTGAFLQAIQLLLAIFCCCWRSWWHSCVTCAESTAVS